MATNGRVAELEEDGVLYQLQLSDNSATGYQGVYVPHAGKGFHAKVTPVTGGGQVTLPGEACATPELAALRLAKYKLNPYPIEKKQERAKRGEAQVCCRLRAL